MKPWDIRAALLAKHAQHVVLIHFPIALFVVGVLFDALAAWTRRQDLASAASWNLCAAALATLPAVVTGLLAWQWELEGRHLKGTLLLHLIAASASALLILAVWWIHRRGRRSGKRSFYHWPLEALGVVLVAVTGHLGGILSGVNHP